MGLSAMALLPRLRFGRDPETEALERRVSSLQVALNKCGEAAGRWTEFRRGVSVALALLMLTLGFALGVYREPIRQFLAALPEAIGLASRAPSAEEAYDAYKKGDYEAALRLAAPLAAQGDVRAQSLLGLVYYHGPAGRPNHGEALTWFRRAAEQGDATAQFQLGLMFSEGQGVPQDYAEAAKWFQRAADQGDAQAQYNLGISHARGQGGEPDNVSAYMWFNLAAARFPPSDIRHDTAVASRDLVAKQMTREQIAEAQKRAREWMPK
jgi:TPR repeat protein